MQLPLNPSRLYIHGFFLDSPLGVYAPSFPPFLRRDKIMNLFFLTNLSPVSCKWKTQKLFARYCSVRSGHQANSLLSLVNNFARVPGSSWWFSTLCFQHHVSCNSSSAPCWQSSLRSWQQKSVTALKNHSTKPAGEGELLKRIPKMVFLVTCRVLQRENCFCGSDPWPFFLLCLAEPLTSPWSCPVSSELLMFT